MKGTPVLILVHLTVSLAIYEGYANPYEGYANHYEPKKVDSYHTSYTSYTSYALPSQTLSYPPPVPYTKPEPVYNTYYTIQEPGIWDSITGQSSKQQIMHDNSMRVVCVANCD
jgi:hypothetical protein